MAIVTEPLSGLMRKSIIAKPCDRMSFLYAIGNKILIVPQNASVLCRFDRKLLGMYCLAR